MTSALATIPEELTLSISLLTDAASNPEAFLPILYEIDSEDFVKFLKKLEADNRMDVPMSLCRLNYALGILTRILKGLDDLYFSLRMDKTFSYVRAGIKRSIVVVECLIFNFNAKYTAYVHTCYNDAVSIRDPNPRPPPLANMARQGVFDDSGNPFREYKGSFFDPYPSEFIRRFQSDKGSNP